MAKKEDPELTARYADMLSAMGTEPRLRIVRLLLSAHPEGLVVGEVGEELRIPLSLTWWPDFNARFANACAKAPLR